ncbi:hypothetical protein [Massilia psychrophila]|nr:hypothetical protein [Massilia psychrophila]
MSRSPARNAGQADVLWIKNRIISSLASGPVASVWVPRRLPPDLLR